MRKDNVSGGNFRVFTGFVGSLLWPGLGQLLARSWALGAKMMTAWATFLVGIAVAMEKLAPTPAHFAIVFLLCVIGFCFAVNAASDAARRIRAEDEDARPPWIRTALLATLGASTIALGLEFALPTPLPAWRLLNTIAGAMRPTLSSGDVFIADLRAFKPRRGDVIIFSSRGVIAVSRVVGEPGDTVQMKGGRLFINGAMTPREEIARTKMYISGDPVSVATYRETLPGEVSHTIWELDADRGALDTTQIFSIPADALFVLGDNRDNSADSRIPIAEGGRSFIPLSAVKGKAATIVGSSDFSRILSPVR